MRLQQNTLQRPSLLVISKQKIDSRSFLELPNLMNSIVAVQECDATVADSSNLPAQYYYQPKTQANISGATMVASLSIIYFGVLISSLPQVIFSFGWAPE